MRRQLVSAALFCSLPFPVLLQGQRVPLPQANKQNSISISAKLPHRAPLVFAAAVQAVAEAGFAIADSSSVRGEIVTQPKFSWPTGTESENWHPESSPGVALIIAAVATGTDSTAFAVTAIAPVQHAESEAGLSNLRSISALQVANGVSKLLKNSASTKP